jgi:glycerol-3-phosphate dehydrogenase
MKNEDALTRFTENYKGEKFDIIIIGGGISGAAIAYDAASRGLSVALIDKKDFGGATSAVTSKLIHGGLRYLATMEFGLVRESLRERRIMENIAPNFVYPIPFMVTTNRTKLTNTKWVIKIGMMLYDILSFDKAFTWDRSKRMPLHTTYSKKKVRELEPNVKDEGLTGASVYYDCISIFPERLTLAFIKSAVQYGAKVANYAEAVGFLHSDDNRIAGVTVLDTITGKKIDVAGRLTLNCGGPWADIILGLAKKKVQGEHLRRSEGIHLITRKLVYDHAVGSITSEGRHIFVIPWREHSLIGTTDKEYVGSPDEYHVTAQSIMELLDEVNASFGDGSLSFDDVLYVYGGLRPLVEDQTKDVYESSRKYEIYDNRRDGLDGLITVEGGKYTTSRNLAENALKLIGRKLGKRLPRTITDKTYLHGSEIPDISDFLQKIIRDNPDFDRRTVEYLGKIYGLEYSRVLEIARKDKSLAVTVDDDGEILAQVAYAARFESAKTLNDILFRRTGIGTLGNPGDTVLRAAARVAARELGWGPGRTREELAKAVRALTVPLSDTQDRAASKKRSRAGANKKHVKRSKK